MSRGDLTGAYLAGADLGRADLTADADLREANLSSAYLTGADLSGAHLTMAKNLTQQQLDAVRGNEDTKLPAGLQRPAHWSAEPAPPAADR